MKLPPALTLIKLHQINKSFISNQTTLILHYIFFFLFYIYRFLFKFLYFGLLFSTKFLFVAINILETQIILFDII